MNSSTPTGTMLQMENMSEKLVELFSSGMTLGEIYNYTEQDYEVAHNLGHNLVQPRSLSRRDEGIQLSGHVSSSSSAASTTPWPLRCRC